MTYMKISQAQLLHFFLFISIIIPLAASSEETGFKINNTGTLFQNSTGILWQNGGDGKGRDWCEARVYCDQLELDGCSNWRLPTKEELIALTEENSLIEYKNGTSVLDAVFHYYYWTESFEYKDKYHSGAFSVHGINADSGLNSIDKKEQVRCACGDLPEDFYTFVITSFVAESYTGMSPFAPQLYVSVIDNCNLPIGNPPYTFSFNFGDGNTETLKSETGTLTTRHPYYITGSYTVKVTAMDANGKRASSELTLQVTSDGTPPDIVINLPVDGSVLKEMARIICEVKDERKIQEVKLYVDGKAYGKMEETNLFIWEADFNSYSFKNGPHELTIKAFNDQGLMGSDSINITTDN